MDEEPGRRQQILRAAFAEFASKGVEKTTIKDIARAADIRSPALIYWYFEDKEALFREVLSTYVPLLRIVIHDPERLMSLPPNEALIEVGRSYFEFEQLDVRTLKLIMSEVVRRPEVAEVFARSGPARVLGFLREYFQRQTELGRFRSHDVRFSAMAFMGMLMPHLAGKLFMPSLDHGLADEEYLKAAVETFIRGLAPEGN